MTATFTEDLFRITHLVAFFIPHAGRLGYVTGYMPDPVYGLFTLRLADSTHFVAAPPHCLITGCA